jgi:predicted amidophosphoribosyltransferase
MKKRTPRPSERPAHAVEIEGITTAEPATLQEKAAVMMSKPKITGPKVMIKCSSCGEDTPSDEQWCSNCGVMIGVATKEATECPECGALIQPGGICSNCGHTPGGMPALVPEKDLSSPGTECPRCYAPIAKGAKFCNVCGADLDKQMAKQKKKDDRIAQMKADAAPGAKPMSEGKPSEPTIPLPPGIPSPYAPPETETGPREECPRCLAQLDPGSKFCGVCGGDIEKLMKKLKDKDDRIAQMKADAAPGARPMPEPKKGSGSTQKSTSAPPSTKPGAPEEKKKCKCGASIEPGAKWCDVCGEKV